MKKIIKKWEGGAKKHGGFGKAMSVQIDKWEQSAEEHARQAREAEERERLEQEEIKQALEFSQKQAEELEQLRLAEKLSKESFEKSQRGKIINFLRSPDDVSDDVALAALDIVKRWESTNEELIEKLPDFGNEALDKFLSSVEIAGDSSF